MAAKAELLSPAGDRERLRLAVLYGADAVYLAGRQFGMRSSAVNFSDEDLRWAVDYAHARGVKIYVTCNTLPREEELRELPALQGEILEALAGCVRPGGTLLYSTCTILREENGAVVEDFLARHPAFEAADFTLGDIRSENGQYTFWPQRDGTDGFFVSKLKRTAT